MRIDQALEAVRRLSAPIFDKQSAELAPETGFFTELQAESIDLLELGLALSREFGLSLDEDQAFLTSFSFEARKVAQSDASSVQAILQNKYPHLPPGRLEELLVWAQGTDAVSPLSIADVAAYLTWRSAKDQGHA